MALRPRTPTSAWGKAASTGLEAGLSVAIGMALGYYADRWLGTEPWLFFLFMILGFFAGMRRLFLLARFPDEAGSSPSPEDASSSPSSGSDDEASP